MIPIALLGAALAGVLLMLAAVCGFRWRPESASIAAWTIGVAVCGWLVFRAGRTHARLGRRHLLLQASRASAWFWLRIAAGCLAVSWWLPMALREVRLPSWGGPLAVAGWLASVAGGLAAAGLALQAVRRRRAQRRGHRSATSSPSPTGSSGA